ERGIQAGEILAHERVDVAHRAKWDRESRLRLFQEIARITRGARRIGARLSEREACLHLARDPQKLALDPLERSPSSSSYRDATQVLLGTRQCTCFSAPVGAAGRQSITRLASA